MAYYNKYSNRYRKSYDNSTRQTYGQRYSPTKHYGRWYDASGNRIRDKEAYFDTVDRNGRYWEE
jgi:hypothetical protein